MIHEQHRWTRLKLSRETFELHEYKFRFFFFLKSVYLIHKENYTFNSVSMNLIILSLL